MITQSLKEIRCAFKFQLSIIKDWKENHKKEYLRLVNELKKSMK